MNTEVLRELKAMMIMTRILAVLPRLQTVAAAIVDAGNSDGRVPFCPDVFVLITIKIVSFKFVAFPIVPLFLSTLKKKENKLVGF